MKTFKIFIIIITCYGLLISLSGCKYEKEMIVEIPEFSKMYEWKYAIVHSSPFTDKAGREHHEIRDYFITTKDGDYFIKLSECKVKNLKIDQLNAHLVKVRVKIEDGLWDTNDPNVQSRVGSYAVFDSIQIIGNPVGFVYADGNGNKYTISKDKIIYDPISATESSSGVYSGGEEKTVVIDSKTFYILFLRAYGIIKNTDLHIRYREMGSYLLNIELKDKNLVKNISDCEQAKELKDKLDKLLNPVSE